MSKVLVRATNWLGDAVMSLPAIRAIRQVFPHAHVAVLARPSVADLYARETAIDGRASTATCACGKTCRMARMAGSDITASPSQLVARTNTFDMEDGLKATNSQNSKGGIRLRLVPRYFTSPSGLANRASSTGTLFLASLT